MPMHPLPIMINNGLPVALCSDDPAVFGNMGLTYDYFQARPLSRSNLSCSHCTTGSRGERAERVNYPGRVGEGQHQGDCPNVKAMGAVNDLCIVFLPHR